MANSPNEVVGRLEDEVVPRKEGSRHILLILPQSPQIWRSIFSVLSVLYGPVTMPRRLINIRTLNAKSVTSVRLTTNG